MHTEDFGNSELKHLLDSNDIHGVLRKLNSRTSFRFTGLYVFDGDTLRNFALFDRWSPAETKGADAPMSETYCAIAGRLNRGLEVEDGQADDRFPWMQGNPVLSYCGVPIHAPDGQAVGTVCHFDLQSCEAPDTEVELLQGVTPFLYPLLAQHLR